DGAPEAAAGACRGRGRRRVGTLAGLNGRFQPRSAIAGGHLAGDAHDVGDCCHLVDVLILQSRGLAGRGRIGARAGVVAAVRVTPVGAAAISATAVVFTAAFKEPSAEVAGRANSDAGTHLALDI